MLAETLVTQCSPCYSAVFSSLMNPLPDFSNYSLICHTHYLIFWINTSLVCSGQTLYQPAPLETNTYCCSALLQNLVGNSGETQFLVRKLNNKQRQVLLFFSTSSNCHLSSLLSLFSLSLSSLCSLSQSSLFSLSAFPLTSPPSLLSLLINSCPLKITTSSFIQLVYLAKHH